MKNVPKMREAATSGPPVQKKYIYNEREKRLLFTTNLF